MNVLPGVETQQRLRRLCLPGSACCPAWPMALQHCQPGAGSARGRQSCWRLPAATETSTCCRCRGPELSCPSHLADDARTLRRSGTAPSVHPPCWHHWRKGPCLEARWKERVATDPQHSPPRPPARRGRGASRRRCRAAPQRCPGRRQRGWRRFPKHRRRSGERQSCLQHLQASSLECCASQRKRCCSGQMTFVARVPRLPVCCGQKQIQSA